MTDRTSKVSRPRDEDPTAFTSLLEQVVMGCPGAIAAIFSDAEGETIDYCSFIESFETKIAAAQWSSIVGGLSDLLAKLELGELEALHIRASQMDFLIQAVGSGYYLTVLLARGVGWGHALTQCKAIAMALRHESRI